MNINDIYSISTAIKSFCLTIVAELVGIAMFYIIEMNTETDFYYGNYLAFGLLVFFSVSILNFILNYIFIFRKINVSTKQRFILATLTVIVTAPYLFLLPSGFVY